MLRDNASPFVEAHVRYPSWVAELDWQRTYTDDTDKMRLAIRVAERNVRERTGGPFGAAIFVASSGELVAVGMNQVVNSNNSTLHGEMVAFQLAQARLGTFSLRECELFTSCEPCAMCLGATLWSGVNRIVCAATGDDARAIGVDEGPVFEASWEYLSGRVAVRREFLRREGARVLDSYVRSGAPIYNG